MAMDKHKRQPPRLLPKPQDTVPCECCNRAPATVTIDYCCPAEVCAECAGLLRARFTCPFCGE